MSEDKLRGLLAEAVPLNTPCPSCLRTMEEERRGYGREGCANTALRLRIDAALAEPVVDWQPHEPVERTEYVVRVERERDEARAEVERLRNALAAISLDEYESTSSASEKVHGHARIARKALHGEKP